MTQHVIWKTLNALVVVSGVLVLYGVLTDARPALAQTQISCPLPEGATPPADPAVTARQVEDGSATLEDFALAVRERSREYARGAASHEEAVYIGCIVRQEDGIWRSGSTYIVSLTLDGRVYIHAKNMALSGRQLNPLIYGSILLSLGVPQTVLLNLASPDPATAGQALNALLGTLSQEPDGAFDATVPIPGLSPGIPGASGHTAVYVDPNIGSPVVLLVGFDINELHLVNEVIDYGDPTITAMEVVDRETLKAFVTQAGEHLLEFMQSGDAAASSKFRLALRDPNGPWRHGSVYLYVLDLNSNTILFHAAFPDEFEYRPLTPTVRDAVTGEYILPQVIEAAKGNPEGGFVEYYFDDPTDDTDSADVPKLGYAREFAAEIQRPDGSVVSADFIIGSGLYGRAPVTAVPDPCPLPAGVSPPPDPAVTAQQVEDGSASLRDFTLAARERLNLEIGAGQYLYNLCRIRQEGGPYRSGSTYLVQLTPDRRVYVHAKQMALSGRRIKASIYTSILTALGVTPADLAKLGSADPAIRVPALAALNNLLSQEPDGAFDGTRFGAPGASGHAGSYYSEHLGVPTVLLAGFDLNETHLDEEVIDYGDPAITASEVVDRETLKAFVGEAGEYYLNLFQTEGRASSTRSRVALRDPNGPWRHGSVYLYVLDLTSNTILVHGAFPDRFELRPLVATVRDVVTGELILPQVIEAAKSNPEGGFVEYYFDDPSDDTDSADVPKVGYARRFTGELPRPDGSVLPIDVIIGSGFYGRAPEIVAPCPLPDGVAPPLDPAVTAQQVEDGSASLRDFTLAARERLNVEIGDGVYLYNLCLIRREGGPYRSGSTYLVQLTPDRRVYVHAKQMALSGRRIKASLYTAILTALGVTPADLVRLQSTDPAIRGPAYAAFIDLLSQEPDGPFDGTRFGVPGASGHVGSYYSEHLGVPVLLLAGLDLNESHLDEEVIDYGDPAITASEVVDRRTLKAFVAEAGKYFLNLFQTEGRASSTKSRVALRDPNGPWRHGSVYLYVLDLTSNTILVHGAFPDRFELRPLVATVRDVVTGELILPQVIEAAKSDPEGGFVEYYFDDPTDDTDSADVPKLGYARRFTGELPRADGSVLPIDVIIGSGLYNPAPDEPLEITLTVSPATLTEDGGVQTVTVTATQSNAPIPVASVIDLSLSGTASADDYSVAGDLVITIPARATEGSTELTFTVTDDTVYESGGETIVITARSEDVDLDTATISVTDSYDAPATIGTPPVVTLEAGDDETVDAGPLFSGTDLSYSASSADNGVVEAVMSGAALTVTGVRKGGATVTVSARNAAGEASLAVSVTVTAIAAEREAYENILAAMGRSMLSSVSATIGGRFSAGGGREITVGGRRIGGLASGITALAGLTGHGRQTATREMALLQGAERRRIASGDYLLRTSSFSYAMEDHTGSGGLRWSVWGAGDLQNFEGEPDVDTSYDGSLKTAYLGFDVATGRSWLAGIALSRAMGESDYDVTVASGSLESRLTAVLPYLRWACPTGFTEVWTIVGLGTGEAEVEDGTSDLSMRMGMLGARSRLASSGGLRLDLVGDAGLLRLSTSDSESAALSDIATGVQRIRVGLEGSRTTALGGGTSVTPYAQVAGRYDGGDGQTGQGLEVSGGLRLTGGRVGLNARGRFLAVHSAEGYRENGVSLVAYLRPAADGRGLSMSVAPRMGAGTTDSGMMWRERPLAASTLRGGSRARSMRAEVGYGLASSPTGVLFTPFGDLYLDGDERRQLRLGARIGGADLGPRTGSLELSGSRIDRRGASDHRIGLIARMSF